MALMYLSTIDKVGEWMAFLLETTQIHALVLDLITVKQPFKLRAVHVSMLLVSMQVL